MADIYANMGKNLIGTKTFDNLMEAFAGESQARNKYTYFASKARKDGYEQIAKIFEQTAANEKEHAKIWYKILEGVHGTKDNVIPFSHGKALFELANEPKRFVSVDCGYHNLLPISLGENRYRELIADFMENGIREGFRQD